MGANLTSMVCIRITILRFKLLAFDIVAHTNLHCFIHCFWVLWKHQYPWATCGRLLWLWNTKTLIHGSLLQAYSGHFVLHFFIASIEEWVGTFLQERKVIKTLRSVWKCLTSLKRYSVHHREEELEREKQCRLSRRARRYRRIWWSIQRSWR